MAKQILVVTLAVEPDIRRLIETSVPSQIHCQFLQELPIDDRKQAIVQADALLARLPYDELGEGLVDSLHSDQVIQLISAGVDHVQFEHLPDCITLQNNAGAHAQPIAEHILAMYLSLSKRLRIEHSNLLSGEFNQFHPNLRVKGSSCIIFGYGGIGQAAANLLKTVGVSIFAINRSGETDEDVDFIGEPDELDAILPRADGLVLSAPLTKETKGIIDREKLAKMPDDGILINVARGKLIDQKDLYQHLHENSDFRAGLDAWWDEPLYDGQFQTQYPFLELPNVIGSPHNAAQIPGIWEHSIQRALDNVVATLTTGQSHRVVNTDRGY